MFSTTKMGGPWRCTLKPTLLATDFELLTTEIVSLSHLEWLIVESNYDIPPEIDNLTNLKGMWFVGTEQIPPEVGNLDSLIALTIIASGHPKIPPQFFNLTNLEYLQLGGPAWGRLSTV